MSYDYFSLLKQFNILSISDLIELGDLIFIVEIIQGVKTCPTFLLSCSIVVIRQGCRHIYMFYYFKSEPLLRRFWVAANRWHTRFDLFQVNPNRLKKMVRTTN